LDRNVEIGFCFQDPEIAVIRTVLQTNQELFADKFDDVDAQLADQREKIDEIRVSSLLLGLSGGRNLFSFLTKSNAEKTSDCRVRSHGSAA